MYLTSCREAHPCIKLHVYTPRIHKDHLRLTHLLVYVYRQHNGNHNDMMYTSLLLLICMVFRSYIYLVVLSYYWAVALVKKNLRKLRYTLRSIYEVKYRSLSYCYVYLRSLPSRMLLCIVDCPVLSGLRQSP